jgi:hypothetical protein
MEHLFIVVYKHMEGARWKALNDGEFTKRRLAENMIEICQAQGSTWEFGIVDGPVVTPETTEQRIEQGNRELGVFA